MDPAALSFGVVSLALQIVETAVVIRRYIRAYKSAPQEIQGLSDKLDDIEAVCNSLELIIDGYERASQPRGEAMLSHLKKSMEKCRNRVCTLHGIISQIVSQVQKTQNPLISTGVLFLRHRSELRKCDDDLTDSLRVLHFHVSVTTCILTVRSSAVQNEELLTKASSGALQSAKVLPKPLVPQGQTITPKRVVSFYLQRRCYRRIFSWEYSETDWKTSGPKSSNLDLIEQESSLLIGSPLFGLYAKLSVRRGPFSPWGFAIEIPHFIDFDDEYLGSIMKSDNLPLFQRALGDGLIRSNTMVENDTYSKLLFEYAIDCDAFAICNFLVQLDDLKLKDRIVCRTPALIYVKNKIPVYVRMVLDILGPWITIQYFESLLNLVFQPTDAIWLIDACEPFFLDDINSFYAIIWASLVDRFLLRRVNGFMSKDEAWCCVAQRISCSIYSPEVHDCIGKCSFVTGPRLRHKTPLAFILTRAQTSLESQLLVRQWLEFLHHSGVDWVRYLELENRILGRAVGEDLDMSECHVSDLLYMYKRVLGKACWGGLEFPFWELNVRESCPIRELVMEYPYVAQWGFCNMYFFLSVLIYGRLFGELRTGGLHEDDWPIRRAEDVGMDWDERTIRRSLKTSRFNRKQLRKLRKRRKLEGGFCPKQEIPGTWRDEFDV